jgi:hypothetical protein
MSSSNPSKLDGQSLDISLASTTVAVVAVDEYRQKDQLKPREEFEKPPRQITAPFIYRIIDLEDYSHGDYTLYPEQLLHATEVNYEEVMKRITRRITSGKLKSARIKDLVDILDDLDPYLPGYP